MESEWTTLILGNICSKIGSGATPRGGQSVYLDQGEVSLIRSQNIYNEGFSHSGLTYITEEHAEQLNNVVVEPDDVLLNITGDSVARCCQVDNNLLPARVNQHVAIIRPDSSILDPRYLRFYLISPLMQSKMLSWAGSGGTRNALTKGMIESFEIPAPPIDEQRAIAAVLGALDDKIELNRRMNGTLEATARALFRSWFVDFDPTRAKMDGRPTGLPAEIAALFPGGMEDGEDGVERPLGWGVGTFSDLIQPTIGGDWGNDNSFESSVDVICLRGVDLERLRSTGWSDAPSRWIKQSSLIKRQLTDCDILVAASGVGPLGRPLWTTPKMQNVYGKPVIYSNFCKRFRARTPAQAIYADRVLHNMRESDEIWIYASGTSIPNLNQEALLTMHPIVIPPNEIIEHFSKFIRPIYEKLFNPESLTLAALRDALLPKLMSGEVRVSLTEETAADAL